MRLIKAFFLGLKEGFQEPYDLSCGMTYDDNPNSPCSRAYDWGANVGQFVGSGGETRAWRC